MKPKAVLAVMSWLVGMTMGSLFVLATRSTDDVEALHRAQHALAEEHMRDWIEIRLAVQSALQDEFAKWNAYSGSRGLTITDSGTATTIYMSPSLEGLADLGESYRFLKQDSDGDYIYVLVPPKEAR